MQKNRKKVEYLVDGKVGGSYMVRT
jgi:hypothetical protein